MRACHLLHQATAYWTFPNTIFISMREIVRLTFYHFLSQRNIYFYEACSQRNIHFYEEHMLLLEKNKIIYHASSLFASHTEAIKDIIEEHQSHYLSHFVSEQVQRRCIYSAWMSNNIRCQERKTQFDRDILLLLSKIKLQRNFKKISC